MRKSSEGIIESLTWVELLLGMVGKARRGLRKKCLDGILKFKGGEVTDQGAEAVRFLKEDCKFIGYGVNICYVMEEGSNEDEENALWIHPFSIPTPMYKVKNTPFIVVANENLDYNKSVLTSIPANKYNKELMDFIDDVRGIQG